MTCMTWQLCRLDRLPHIISSVYERNAVAADIAVRLCFAMRRLIHSSIQFNSKYMLLILRVENHTKRQYYRSRTMIRTENKHNANTWLLTSNSWHPHQTGWSNVMQHHRTQEIESPSTLLYY
jgi:hypothetical protein